MERFHHIPGHAAAKEVLANADRASHHGYLIEGPRAWGAMAGRAFVRALVDYFRPTVR